VIITAISGMVSRLCHSARFCVYYCWTRRCGTVSAPLKIRFCATGPETDMALYYLIGLMSDYILPTNINTTSMMTLNSKTPSLCLKLSFDKPDNDELLHSSQCKNKHADRDQIFHLLVSHIPNIQLLHRLLHTEPVRAFPLWHDKLDNSHL
jgi:hypothetical protein